MSRKWIFLRGLTRGVGHWGEFVDIFKKKFPEDEVELIDIPGNGARFNESSPSKIKDYVNPIRDCSKFVKQGPIHLLAVSLGGMIGIEWLNQYPNDIAKAHLFCTSSGEVSKFYERLQPINYKYLYDIARALPGRQQENCILKMISQNKENAQKALSTLAYYSKHHPVSIKNSLAQMVAASSFKSPLLHPDKVHWIGSWGDRMVAPECTLKLAEKYQSKPTMHPWSGHDIALDDPEWLVEQLQG